MLRFIAISLFGLLFKILNVGLFIKTINVAVTSFTSVSKIYDCEDVDSRYIQKVSSTQVRSLGGMDRRVGRF